MNMKQEKKAIAYVRTATSEQDKIKPGSLKVQTEIIHEHAKRNNIKIKHVFEQAGRESTELHNALDYCQKNPDVTYLLISRVDRLGRRFEDIAYWQEAFRQIGVKLRTPEMKEPTSLMIENLLMVFARYEQELRSIRIKRGLRQKKIEAKQ